MPSCHCSVASPVRLCDPMDCSTLGFPILHYSLELLRLLSMKSIKPSKHLICLPLLLLPSTFPSIREMAGDGNFPVNWLFTSGGQSIGASASVLLMKIQGWFPLGLTGLISLLSKGLSRAFQHRSSKASSLPAPQFESINSSALSLLYSSTFTSILLEKP